MRRARSTVWKVLACNGPLAPPSRAQATLPPLRVVALGALLHLDAKKLARFREPGHRATGDRRELPPRSAYVELHPREDGLTAARVLERALAELASLGLAPEALMTDNASAYTCSRRFREIPASVGARHIVIPPYTPRWNGKVEALIKTLLREWAQVRTWQSSSERGTALSSFVRYYNRRRPHNSPGVRPPLSRVANVFLSYT